MEQKHLSICLSIVEKYDMKATLFLIMNKFKDDTLPDTFQEMKENGMELQSHSYAMHTGGCDGGHGGALRCVDLDTGIKDTKSLFHYRRRLCILLSLW